MKLKDVRKREETSNHWRIWELVSGNKLSAAVIVVEVIKAGETIKINERNEVERNIMTCISKRFSLTNDNSTMEDDFMSKVGYLAEKIMSRRYIKRRDTTNITRW